MQQLTNTYGRQPRIASINQIAEGLRNQGYFRESTYDDRTGRTGSFEVIDPRPMYRDQMQSILETIQQMSRDPGMHPLDYNAQAQQLRNTYGMLGTNLNNYEESFRNARPRVVDPTLSAIGPQYGRIALSPEQHAGLSRRLQYQQQEQQPFRYAPQMSHFENRLMGMSDDKGAVTDSSLRSLGYNTKGQVEEMINALRRMNKVAAMGAKNPKTYQEI